MPVTREALSWPVVAPVRVARALVEEGRGAAVAVDGVAPGGDEIRAPATVVAAVAVLLRRAVRWR